MSRRCVCGSPAGATSSPRYGSTAAWLDAGWLIARAPRASARGVLPRGLYHRPFDRMKCKQGPTHTMKLIGSLASPYVRKVRIVMAEKRLDYQLELEDVWSSDHILACNPLGKVPCLVMEGGEAVFDSRVIVEYVDTLSPVGRLIP